MLNFLIELYRNARVEKCKPSFLSFGRQIYTMVPAIPSGDARIWGRESQASLNRFASVPDIILFFSAQISGGWYKMPKFLPDYMELLT